MAKAAFFQQCPRRHNLDFRTRSQKGIHIGPSVGIQDANHLQQYADDNGRFVTLSSGNVTKHLLRMRVYSGGHGQLTAIVHYGEPTQRVAFDQLRPCNLHNADDGCCLGLFDTCPRGTKVQRMTQV